MGGGQGGPRNVEGADQWRSGGGQGEGGDQSTTGKFSNLKGSKGKHVDLSLNTPIILQGG